MLVFNIQEKKFILANIGKFDSSQIQKFLPSICI